MLKSAHIFWPWTKIADPILSLFLIIPFPGRENVNLSSLAYLVRTKIDQSSPPQEEEKKRTVTRRKEEQLLG